MDEQLAQPLGRDRRACQFVGQQVAQRFVEVLVIEDGGLQEVAEGGLGQEVGGSLLADAIPDFGMGHGTARFFEVRTIEE